MSIDALLTDDRRGGINPGNYRATAVLRKPTETVSAIGGVEKSFADFRSVRCNARAKSVGVESHEASGFFNKYKTHFRFRYYPSIDAELEENWEVVFRGRVYGVESIHRFPEDRPTEFVVECEFLRVLDGFGLVFDQSSLLTAMAFFSKETLGGPKTLTESDLILQVFDGASTTVDLPVVSPGLQKVFRISNISSASIYTVRYNAATVIQVFPDQAMWLYGDPTGWFGSN